MERRRQYEMIEAQRRQNAEAASKALMAEERKRMDAELLKQQKMYRLEMFNQKKKIKREWKEMQDAMLQ